jgi:hypothetical protein
MTTIPRTLSRALALVLLVVLAGCLDLQVTNLNNPDRDRALDNPSDVETLIASSWFPYWNRTQVQGSVYHPMTAIAGLHITSVANNAGLLLSDIPRPQYDNNPVSEPSGLARFPYYDFYSGLDSANEGLRSIADGMEFGNDGEDTERARAFAKFTQGLLLGYLGLFFDQAMVAKEDTDVSVPENLVFVPHDEVIEAAAASLEEAAAVASANSFEIPFNWNNHFVADNQELAQVAHSFIARFLVYSARTPEERDAVDWPRVISHLDRGIQQDVVVDHQTGDLSSSNFKRRITGGIDAFNSHRVYSKFIGKADVSGNYQAWLAMPLEERTRFHVETPDRRFTAGPSDTDGKYYRYLTTNPFRDERGTWRQSFYQFDRWDGVWRNAPLVVMTTGEMDLIRAEAHLRMGQLEQAAELINISRVGIGELPPVTAQGVPQSDDCVPRTDAGACMDLLGALWYERMHEATGLEAPRDWMDQRGFGMLEEGTFLHLPVPGRELETLALPIYTFGGAGGPGAAPAPRW